MWLLVKHDQLLANATQQQQGMYATSCCCLPTTVSANVHVQQELQSGLHNSAETRQAEAQPAFPLSLQDQVQPRTDHLSATAISDLAQHHLPHRGPQGPGSLQHSCQPKGAVLSEAARTTCGVCEAPEHLST
jgi:hypothetical protein